MNHRGHITSSRDWQQWDEQQPIFERIEEPVHLTPADLCLYGKPGPKCGCGFCVEMVARQREGSERI